MNPTGTQIDLGGGRLFDPLNPCGFPFRIEDIAGPLSRICRWGGRCSAFYSVAQHSLFVAEQVAAHEPGLELHALLHDAAEAFLGDVPTPIKRWLELRVASGHARTFDLVEHDLLDEIHRRLGLRALEPHEDALVRQADRVALCTEARDLMGDPGWAIGPRDTRRIEPLIPEAAERAFLAAFERLVAQEIGK